MAVVDHLVLCLLFVVLVVLFLLLVLLFVLLGFVVLVLLVDVLCFSDKKKNKK